MIKFEKVSSEQYMKDLSDIRSLTIFDVRDYEELKLPARSTSGSAGYDFYAPYDLDIKKGEVFKCITGIRFVTDEKVFLMCCPRSGLGCKHGFRLRNTIGIIDSDYQHAVNEGHIMAIIEAEEDITVPKGKAFMQGIILPYITTSDDTLIDGESMVKRTGGFGSTDK